MPIYTFSCPFCGHVVELIQRMNDDHSPPACPDCEVMTRRVYQMQPPIYIGLDFTQSADSREEKTAWEDPNRGRKTYHMGSGK